MSTRSTPRRRSKEPSPSITPWPPFGKLTVTEVARWTPPACSLFVAADEIRFPVLFEPQPSKRRRDRDQREHREQPAHETPAGPGIRPAPSPHPGHTLALELPLAAKLFRVAALARRGRVAYRALCTEQGRE